jgi:transcriptional regulator with XRE-family HTH domain
MKTEPFPTSPRSRIDADDRIIARNIRRERITRGWSQQRLADEIGVTYQQAHKYERGVNRASGGRLAMIARAFGIAPGTLFDGVDQTPVLSRDSRELVNIANMVARLSPEHRKAIKAMARHFLEG